MAARESNSGSKHPQRSRSSVPNFQAGQRTTIPGEESEHIQRYEENLWNKRRDLIFSPQTNSQEWFVLPSSGNRTCVAFGSSTTPSSLFQVCNLMEHHQADSRWLHQDQRKRKDRLSPMDHQPLPPPSRQHLPRREAQRKRLHLLPGPAIAGYQIQRNEENHAIVINGLMMRCTPDEYRLLLTLMERYEQPVLFEELIAQFQDDSFADLALLKAARRKLTCTLSDLRAKL